MLKHLHLKSLFLLLCLLVGKSSAWASENDTHDFSQSLQQLLNNNASITPISIAEQQYYVKKVVVSYRYNKTIENAVTVAVSVGGNDWGSKNVVGTGSNYTTMEFTGDAVKGTISISFTNNTGNGTGHGTFYVDKVQVVEGAAPVTGTTSAPSIGGDTPFLNNTTVTITNAASASGADIYYTLNGDDPTTTTSATCFAYTAPFTVDATTTVKAIAKKSTDTNASSVVSKTFTKVTPLTVAQAISATPSSGTSESTYIHGIVSAFFDTDIITDGSNRYYISDDGTTTNQLLVYKGKKSSTEDFSNANDLQIGDEIIIFGGLTTYNSTKEVASGNYIVSLSRKPAPTFSLDPTEATLESYTHETIDVNLTTNTDGEITCESSNSDVATVAKKSDGVYTITAQMEGTATITIKSAASDNFRTAQATVAVTVTDTRADAGISFAENAKTTTWGESFSSQELTNTHSVAVTWSSTDETVATVDNTGAVTVLKAGSTTIKATFVGNATYKAAVASYTLTVNKANAGISYSTTAFEIMLNDDSFVAPTLNNPNGLTVTYASNNTSVATVNATTGELNYVETAVGTAKITATFAGNDWFKSGSANYTINIVDPTVKGCKYNPYTVAEVEGQSTATTFGDNIYVTGYIVGCVKDNKCYKTTTDKLVDTNLLLADTPDFSFTEGSSISNGIIPVELPTALRTNWGVASKNVFSYKVILKGNAKSYFSNKGIKGTTEISAVSIPAKLNASGYATFASNYALDFSDDSEFSAWQITSISGTAITFSQITGKVAAGTGILLKGTASAAINILVAATGSDISATNKLEGVTAAKAISAGEYYGLSGNKFVKVNAGTVPAGKALLPASEISAGARELTFIFEDEITGVSTVKTFFSNDKAMYNLKGQRIDAPRKGEIYIMGGKKMVNK